MPTQTTAFVALRHVCIEESVWCWACEVPVSRSKAAFTGACVQRTSNTGNHSPEYWCECRRVRLYEASAAAQGDWAVPMRGTGGGVRRREL